jgi:hypothetical protein
VLSDFVESLQEELARALVSLAEFLHHLGQLSFDVAFGEGRDSAENLLDPVFIRNLEWPKYDSGIGRLEDDSRAFHIHGKL